MAYTVKVLEPERVIDPIITAKSGLAQSIEGKRIAGWVVPGQVGDG